MFEEFHRGTVTSALEHYRATPPRGEITLVIGGAPPESQTIWDESQVRAALYTLLDDGRPLSSAAKAVAAESGWDRRAVYALGAERGKD